MVRFFGRASTGFRFAPLACATVWMLATALSLAGCASSSAPSAGAAGVTRISIERGPCFGQCPVYRLVANADGAGLFEGRRFTAVAGKRRFVITPDQWSAFVTKLAPYRPNGVEEIIAGHPRCNRMATDHPSAVVTWEGDGRSDRLSFYYGCRDPENADMGRAIADAPDLLEAAAFIETRSNDGPAGMLP